MCIEKILVQEAKIMKAWTQALQDCDGEDAVKGGEDMRLRAKIRSLFVNELNPQHIRLQTFFPAQRYRI